MAMGSLGYGVLYSRLKGRATHLDTSLCVFLSPSKVKGDAPVSSSNMRIPKLHQSTDCTAMEEKTRMKQA